MNKYYVTDDICCKEIVVQAYPDKSGMFLILDLVMFLTWLWRQTRDSLVHLLCSLQRIDLPVAIRSMVQPGWPSRDSIAHDSQR